jgi:hypothetical protein
MAALAICRPKPLTMTMHRCAGRAQCQCAAVAGRAPRAHSQRRGNVTPGKFVSPILPSSSDFIFCFRIEISECGFFLIPKSFFELHFESIQAAAAALSPLLREFNTIPVGELRDNAVVTLDLYRNGVGVVGALALGLLLRTNTSLARLELSEEDITADGKDWSGVAALAAALTGGWEAEEGTAMETKNANREIRVWHGATETGPLMMDKSETLWHDWRSCRYITLCRGVLDFPIIQ